MAAQAEINGSKGDLEGIALGGDPFQVFPHLLRLALRALQCLTINLFDHQRPAQKVEGVGRGIGRERTGVNLVRGC